MATVSININASIAQLSNFADQLGYQEFIITLDEQGNQTQSANPIDRKAYLQDFLKTVVVDKLSEVKIKAIDKEIRDQREAEKQAFKDAVNLAVAVTFKP